MYKKIHKSIFILLILIGSLIPFQIANAGKWHHPNGSGWSVSKVCRDGAVLMGTSQLGIPDIPVANTPEMIWTIYAELVLDTMPGGDPEDTLVIGGLGDSVALEDIINLFAEAPDDTIPVDQLGQQNVHVTTNDFPTLVTDVLANPGTHATYIFGTQNIYYSTPLNVGDIVRLTWRNIEGTYLPGYFLTIVEDCYLSPDASTKLLELQFSVTVST